LNGRQSAGINNQRFRDRRILTLPTLRAPAFKTRPWYGKD
jgi:hypothetical protein